MIFVKLKVPWDLYKELQLCPDMILTRSPSTGSLKFIPDPTSLLLDANKPVNMKENTSTSTSKACKLRPDSSNSALISSANVVQASATNTHSIAYPASSTGSDIIPSTNNNSQSITFLLPVSNKTASVLSGSTTLFVKPIDTDIGVMKSNTRSDCPPVPIAEVLGDSNVNPSVARSGAKSDNSSDAGLRLCTESVFSGDDELFDNGSVKNKGLRDTSLSPIAALVSSDNSMLDKLVVATVENGNIKCVSRCSKSATGSMQSKVVAVVPRRRAKIPYPRQCAFCSKYYKNKVTFSQHKKKCWGKRNESLTPVNHQYHTSTEASCKSISLKDKKWVHFTSQKDGLYVKSAT